MPASSSLFKAYGLLTFTALCWGGNAVFGQLAVDQVSPFFLVTLRWTGALILLISIGFRQTRADWPILKKHLFFLCAMGILGFTLFNALFYVASHSTTALNVGIIQGAMPMFVLVGAFLTYGTRITFIQLCGVLIGLLGVVAVVSRGDWDTLVNLSVNIGDGMMVFACLLYAGYAVGLRRVPAVSSLSVFTVMAAAALAFSFGLTGIEYASGNLQWPTTKGWIVVGLITLFPSFFAQLFFMQGVSIIGPGRAGVFVNLVPVFAAGLAVLLLGERFELYHGIALVLVLAGIGASEIGKPRVN